MYCSCRIKYMELESLWVVNDKKIRKNVFTWSTHDCNVVFCMISSLSSQHSGSNSLYLVWTGYPQWHLDTLYSMYLNFLFKVFMSCIKRWEIFDYRMYYMLQKYLSTSLFKQVAYSHWTWFWCDWWVA